MCPAVLPTGRLKKDVGRLYLGVGGGDDEQAKCVEGPAHRERPQMPAVSIGLGLTIARAQLQPWAAQPRARTGASVGSGEAWRSGRVVTPWLSQGNS